MIVRFATWAHRTMPTRAQMEQSRFIRPFAHRVLASELWRFTRRSVPRGVALGMAVGILMPVAQIVIAAMLSLTVRANVPVAALTTFITNPFTTPLIWAFSYKVGEWLLHVDGIINGSPVDRLLQVADFWQFIQWLTDEGKVLAFGLLVVAVAASAISYVVTGIAWGSWIRAKRRRHVAARGAASASPH
ncbi:MAG: DUF2062 domain-containing protein [Pseudomonadota bacterium]